MSEQKVSDVRKRSPRAPALSLKDALDRALILYEKEGRHAVALDVAAQDLGYKDAGGGAAKTILATLRQFGLIIRPTEGQAVVTRDVENYKFAPEEIERRATLVKWLKIPAVYQHLLTKYNDRLPSDAQLRFELIQQGFSPQTAEEQVKIFKESVEFAKYFEQKASITTENAETDAGDFASDDQENSPRFPTTPQSVIVSATASGRRIEPIALRSDVEERIPIRLSGGRRAYLTIPTPFFEGDKVVIKNQVDLILADDPIAQPVQQDSGDDL